MFRIWAYSTIIDCVCVWLAGAGTLSNYAISAIILSIFICVKTLIYTINNIPIIMMVNIM